jgi:hypothetical protein
VRSDYREIVDHFPTPPLWFNEDGVPRWVPFSPRECADIYADEVILMEIACQSCGHRFNVAMSHGRWDWSNGDVRAHPGWTEPPHYGDPPNIDCCPAGATMNSEHIRVIEWWVQPSAVGEWQRKDLGENT